MKTRFNGDEEDRELYTNALSLHIGQARVGSLSSTSRLPRCVPDRTSLLSFLNVYGFGCYLNCWPVHCSIYYCHNSWRPFSRT